MVNESREHNMEEIEALPATELLRTADLRIATFMAVRPELLDGAAFSSKFKLERMTWIKTSLAWAYRKAERDRIAKQKNRGHIIPREEIIEIDVEPDYFHRLIVQSRDSRTPGSTFQGEPQILRQYDPDRMLVLPNSDGIFSEEFPFRVGKYQDTLHLGLRGNALAQFVGQAAGRIKVVSNGIEEVMQNLMPNSGQGTRSPEDIAHQIYSKLELTPCDMREVFGR